MFYYWWFYFVDCHSPNKFKISFVAIHLSMDTDFTQWKLGRQLTSVNLGVWRKSEKFFFSKKNYILGSVMVQNKYFNTFFVKIDPGAPLKPPKSSFF